MLSDDIKNESKHKWCNNIDVRYTKNIDFYEFVNTDKNFLIYIAKMIFIKSFIFAYCNKLFLFIQVNMELNNTPNIRICLKN